MGLVQVRGFIDREASLEIRKLLLSIVDKTRKLTGKAISERDDSTKVCEK